VRTFHALGREILAEAGVSVANLVDRADVLGRLRGRPLPPAELRRLDDAFSRIKLDLGLSVDDLRDADLAQPRPTAIERDVRAAFVAYEDALRAEDALDFDDLVRRAVALLRSDARLRRTWQERCANLLVDEVQDVDRSQLELAVLLCGDQRNIFLVGDDDQTIYAWRLADATRSVYRSPAWADRPPSSPAGVSPSAGEPFGEVRDERDRCGRTL
ncbi:MAG: UvrD-helicase domain-containing protein, partial [Chloroflexota bacterium]|nr:UvrD-helicase domain-containing protein [Chloroflexota bacterium]